MTTSQYIAHWHLGDPIVTTKDKGGTFDDIDLELENYIIDHPAQGITCSGRLYLLEQKESHHEMIQQMELIRPSGYEFTMDQALCLIDPMCNLFFGEQEDRFIVYLDSKRTLSISLNIRKDKTFKRRIIYCKQIKPFYDYPAGTGVLLPS